MTEGRRSHSRTKLVLILVLVVCIAIVTAQNTESVETKLLFATVAMPRAVFIFGLFAAGMLAGFLLRGRKRR